jgi:transcriptional regulator with XRE-family HTH domain
VTDAIDSSPRRLDDAQVSGGKNQRDVAEPHVSGSLAGPAARGRADIAPALGANLRRLRMRRGLSLERLSKQSRVSRAMLSQIELGRSAPSVNVVWRIASALAVPFSALLSAHNAKNPRILHAHKAQLTSNHDSTFSTRALFPREQAHATEFFQLTIKPHSQGTSPAYAPQTKANLVLGSGSIKLRLGNSTLRLQEGDAAAFDADVEHLYENQDDKVAVLYLVITYPTAVDDH